MSPSFAYRAARTPELRLAPGHVQTCPGCQTIRSGRPRPSGGRVGRVQPLQPLPGAAAGTRAGQARPLPQQRRFSSPLCSSSTVVYWPVRLMLRQIRRESGPGAGQAWSFWRCGHRSGSLMCPLASALSWLVLRRGWVGAAGSRGRRGGAYRAARDAPDSGVHSAPWFRWDLSVCGAPSVLLMDAAVHGLLTTYEPPYGGRGRPTALGLPEVATHAA
jgi:hypothetical protein